MTGLPESLSQLATLTTLYLSECHTLTGLPESLGQLAALTTLTIECRALTGLPESLGQLAALTTLNLSFCLPDSLGQLAELKMLHLRCCQRLTRLPLSSSFLPDILVFTPSESLVFPPLGIVTQSMPAIKAFLLLHHHPPKMLMLILSARRRRMRHLPPELWELIHEEFLSDL